MIQVIFSTSALRQAMCSIKKRVMCCLMVLYLQECNSQKFEIQHLNIIFNRLNRITDGLKQDVDNLWTALSNSLLNKQSDFSEGTNQEQANSNDVMQLVNETVSNVKELKSEVKELVQYAKHGLKKEKMFSRNAINTLQEGQTEFQTVIRMELSNMKNWLQSFKETQVNIQDETFKKIKIKAEEESRKCQLRIQNITNQFTMSLEETKMKSELCYNELDSMKQKDEDFQIQSNKVKDEIAFMKNVINTKLSIGALCNEGWEKFETHCYFFSSDIKTWDEAFDICKFKDSYIAEMNNKDEINFVASKNKGSRSLWIGATNKQTEGIFIWENSKQPVPQNYWNKNEPNNSGGKEHCAELYSYKGDFGELNDSNCKRAKNYVCEKTNYIFQ